ncbi:DUF4177 domain-containing protein [Clostridium intestinale]|uniref:DUF4177 domain-containing protein n=1 Tax=Clostridium intestinale DSM 6191 TaxID=1121320 RepID=A0A1M5USL2_9CLOT|nr:DUF4177 domain-containing protein [Clostridium intestinale]SHH65979.1 protein of unknown function [Clostridium intestinale DSM 6191]
MNSEFRYKVLTVDNFLSLDNSLTIEEKLNKFGKDGWELVGIIQKQAQSLGNPSELNSDNIIFKKASFKLKSNDYQ